MNCAVQCTLYTAVNTVQSSENSTMHCTLYIHYFTQICRVPFNMYIKYYSPNHMSVMQSTSYSGTQCTVENRVQRTIFTVEYSVQQKTKYTEYNVEYNTQLQKKCTIEYIVEQNIVCSRKQCTVYLSEQKNPVHNRTQYTVKHRAQWNKLYIRT